MIKLLKYDWKRSNDGILSTLGILIILEAALSITGSLKNWEEALIISFSIFGYLMAALLLFIHCFRTFDGNIKSFSRRLLPLHPIQGIGSTIILSWIISLLVIAVAVIHLSIYMAFSNQNLSDWNKIIQFKEWGIVGLVVVGIWALTSFVISVLTSITVARSFRMKRTAWIGIIFFFAVRSFSAWLSAALFGQNPSSLGIITFESANANPATLIVGPSLDMDVLFGPFLLELAFVAGYLFIMLYLLNKKVEV